MERKEQTAPQLVILDFDRTISDVGAAMDRLYAVLKQGNYTVNPALLAKARAQAEETGISFSPLAFMRQYDDMEKLQEAFLDQEDVPLLYSDVELFLQVLEAKSVPYIIMSYGEDLEWQELKIRASGVNAPVKLTRKLAKGEEIAALKKNGAYTYETKTHYFEAESVCLIDDKSVSFQGLPEDCGGVWLQRSEELLPRQQGAVSGNVAIMRGGLEELSVVNGKIKVPEE